MKEKSRVCFLYFFAACYLLLLLVQYSNNKKYAEIDSYMLPTISLQYRGSLLMNAEDLKRAQIDYPTLYKGINSYEDFRCSKLIETQTGKWKSYYFPIYSIICMPAKLFLQSFQLDQEWAFGITNVLCLAALFIVILRSKKLLLIQKAVASFLLAACPSFLYVQYISAETMIFSFVGIGMILFYEKRYKTGAVVTTLAGMSNCTVMAIGIVFIIDYYVNVFKENKNKKPIELIKGEILPSFKLSLCFLPVFIPFIFNAVVGAKSDSLNVSMGLLVDEGFFIYFGRVLMYLFDPNLGIFSFAPVLEISCFGIFIYAVFIKKYRAIAFMAAYAGTVAAYSAWYHINCGMLYCARYVYWTYPILVVFMVTAGYECVKSRGRYIAVNLFSAFIGTVLLWYNTNTYYNHVVFNNFTEKILESAPGLYNPLHSTFNSRVLHIDGGYSYKTPILYYDENRYVKKILVAKDDIATLRDLCVGTADHMEWFESQLAALTEKETYISIPKKYQIMYAPKYILGRSILFYSNAYDADLYVLDGLSGKEDGYSWTDGKRVRIRCNIDNPAEIMHGHIKLNMVYMEQDVTVLVNNEEVYHDVVKNGMDIEFDFEMPEKEHLADIEILLPDAASPASAGGSSDERQLGLAIERMVFSESRNDWSYELGKDILFYSDSYNADSYVVRGISENEDGFTWTDDQEVRLCCNVVDDQAEKIHGLIELKDIYKKQNVTVLVDNKQVFQGVVENTSRIEFDFVKKKDRHLIHIKVLLPDAVSPKSLGESLDERTLGLAIKRIVLTENEN